MSLKHTYIPKGTVIMLRAGTKIFNNDGSHYTTSVDYTIEIDYDSSENDGHIFWSNKYCKKINVLVGWRVH